MRLITWLLSLPIFAAVIVFVLQNRMQVEISFWPLDAQATLPVSILALGLLIVGFVLGSLVTGFSTFRASLEARKLRKDVETLNKKLADTTPIANAPPQLYSGRYHTLPPEPPKPAKKGWRLFNRGV